MNNDEINTPTLRGELKSQESLAPLNTWHVGGLAKQTYRPADLADLCVFLKTLPADEKIIWLGLGSNVLIRDQGIDGTVILTHAGLNEMTCDGTSIRVEAGVACAKLAKFCAKQGLTGGCFFAGIPGTLGGALAMNAGAFGGETWPLVKAVEVVNRQGQVELRSAKAFTVSYRHVLMHPDEWFVAAHLILEKTDDVTAEQDKIRALVKERREKQPIGELSCGSVFRNPPGGYAAQLIESCGLKGLKRGDAVVSEKHANFIINIKHARAADIEALILHVQQQVLSQTGIQLITEVHIYGQATSDSKIR
jgi:UDP-N-acetylmuramate dehydrogenase